MEHNLIDAAVHTRDAQDAGRVWRVAMDPNINKVTHLVVHKGFLLGRNVVVPIAAEFPLDQAARAHERLAAGHVLGKIVLRVQPD